jgi:hypothetical protein
MIELKNTSNCVNEMKSDIGLGFTLSVNVTIIELTIYKSMFNICQAFIKICNESTMIRKQNI